MAKTTLEADVCIVGGGASGIALATEFIGAPFDVLLMESGGQTFDHRSQFLYRAQNIGRPYFNVEFTKQRYFGGASNKWFGRCRPLDPIDFEWRPWVEHSGWPFDRQTLDPFYRRASAFCQLGTDTYDPASRESADRRQIPFHDASLETKIFNFSPPSRFGELYAQSILNAANIKTFLFANAVSIALNASGTSVERIRFGSLRHNTFDVKAKYFILAASALENTRLMLASNGVHPRGIGNQNDLLGRFFMEHPHIFDGMLLTPLTAAQARFYKVLDYDTASHNLGTAGALGLTEETIRRERLLNASAFFVQRKPYKTDDRYFGNGGAALTRVMDIVNHRSAPGLHFLGAVGNAGMHWKSIAGIVGLWLKGYVQQGPCVSFRSQLETVPNPDSRVTLSGQKDRFGVPRLNVNWQLTRQDLESYQRFRALLAAGLRRAGFRVRLFAHDLDTSGWPVTMVAGKHHMGTTRMHANPRRGVVDPDGKVHGVNNLLIAGSSVFPTSGQANPMLTIIALAFRMADHVRRLCGD